MQFASPWALLTLLVIPLLLLSRRFRGRPPHVRLPSVIHALTVPASWRQQLAWLPLGLRVAALILLCIGLARPQEGSEKIYDIRKGIAIEMVLDRSSSMQAEMEFAGRTLTRLEVAKQAFAEFVQGNKDDLAGRPNDLIGMINFARFPDTICPLTLAHDGLQGFLDNVKPVDRKSEDGTAIGDALALAAARLQTAEQDFARQAGDREKEYEIKSKVIILLTDGENNSGEISPQQAAAMAREWGITIYTIGVGSPEEISKLGGILGFSFKMPGRGVDEKTLRNLATATGGRFWLAKDGQALHKIYEQIDQLEKSEVESLRYVEYKEFFPRFALIALGLLLMEAGLQNTLFRRLP